MHHQMTGSAAVRPGYRSAPAMLRHIQRRLNAAEPDTGTDAWFARRLVQKLSNQQRRHWQLNRKNRRAAPHLSEVVIYFTPEQLQRFRKEETQRALDGALRHRGKKFVDPSNLGKRQMKGFRKLKQFGPLRIRRPVMQAVTEAVSSFLTKMGLKT